LSIQISLRKVVECSSRSGYSLFQLRSFSWVQMWKNYKKYWDIFAKVILKWNWHLLMVWWSPLSETSLF